MAAGSHPPAYLLFTVIAVMTTVLVALVSWRVIEQPFLAFKRRVPYGPARAVRPLPSSAAEPA